MNEARRDVKDKTEILKKLQSEILSLQGFKAPSDQEVDTGFGLMQQSFPQAIFPTAAIHEFPISSPHEISCAGGFITGIVGTLLQGNKAAAWIAPDTKIFPPALKHFGIDPERIIFIQLKKEKEILWALEEALKCPALGAVVGELHSLSFTASRRLQLAVEQSKVTGFVLRKAMPNLNTTACVARWKITSLSSKPEDGMPGLGFPTWRVELLKIRNGKPGCWNVEWRNDRFYITAEQPDQLETRQSKIA